mgnify:CR=1 FL=1
MGNFNWMKLPLLILIIFKFILNIKISYKMQTHKKLMHLSNRI